MQSHITKTGKDGAIYEKDALSLRGFCRDTKTGGQKNKENAGVFTLVHS